LPVGLVVESWIQNCSNQTENGEDQEWATEPLIPYTTVTISGQIVKVKIQSLLAS
jgi:hypothetical protein